MSSYKIVDLENLMARLRDPKDGCSWDLKQNWQTIPKYTIEETFELVDAIRAGGIDEIQNELGDVLFQIIFYCQFAKEEGKFTFQDVLTGIIQKMTFRHPHIFGDKTGSSLSVKEVEGNWEKLKKLEKAEKESEGQKSEESILAGLPKSLPALQKAEKIQKTVSQVGFDWNQMGPVLDKVAEELQEVREAFKSNDQAHLKEELGDLLFAVVNAIRFAEFEAEEVLHATNQKFVERFQEVEKRGGKLQDLTLDQMEKLWQEAKAKMS